MANPAYVQKVDGNTASGSTVTGVLANTTTANSIAIVSMSGNASTTITGITISSGTAAFAKVIASTGVNYSPTEIWLAPNIVGGTTPTVTVTYSSSAVGEFIAYEVTGYLALDGTAAAADVGTASTSLSVGPVVTSNANDFLLAGFNGAANITSGGWTQYLATAQGDLTEYSIVTSTGSYTATATSASSGVYTGAVAAFKVLAIAENTAKPKVAALMAVTPRYATRPHVLANTAAGVALLGGKLIFPPTLIAAINSSFADAGRLIQRQTITATSSSAVTVAAYRHIYRYPSAFNVSSLMTESNLHWITRPMLIARSLSGMVSTVRIPGAAVEKTLLAGVLAQVSVNPRLVYCPGFSALGLSSLSDNVRQVKRAAFISNVLSQASSKGLNPAYIQGANTSSTSLSITSLSLAYSSPPAAANLLVALVGWSYSGTSPAPTISDTLNTSWLQFGTTNDNGAGLASALFYTSNTLTAADTVAVNFASAVSTPSLLIGEYFGASTVPDGTMGGTRTSSGTSSSPSTGNISSTFGYDVWIAFFVAGAAKASITGSWSLRQNSTQNAYFTDLLPPLSGNNGAGSTLVSSASWLASLFVFKPLSPPVRLFLYAPSDTLTVSTLSVTPRYLLRSSLTSFITTGAGALTRLVTLPTLLAHVSSRSQSNEGLRFPNAAFTSSHVSVTCRFFAVRLETNAIALAVSGLAITWRLVLRPQLRTLVTSAAGETFRLIYRPGIVAAVHSTVTTAGRQMLRPDLVSLITAAMMEHTNQIARPRFAGLITSFSSDSARQIFRPNHWSLVNSLMHESARIVYRPTLYVAVLSQGASSQHTVPPNFPALHASAFAQVLAQPRYLLRPDMISAIHSGLTETVGEILRLTFTAKSSSQLLDNSRFIDRPGMVATFSSSLGLRIGVRVMRLQAAIASGMAIHPRIIQEMQLIAAMLSSAVTATGSPIIRPLLIAVIDSGMAIDFTEFYQPGGPLTGGGEWSRPIIVII